MSQTPKNSLTVCLVSHHPMALEDFREVLAPQGHHIEVFRLESILAPELRGLPLPEAAVYVVDASTPQLATETLVGDILERFPEARVIVLWEEFDEAASFPLLRLGAKALLTYKEARAQLQQVVRAVDEGGFWVPRTVLSRFVDSVLRDLPGGAAALRAPTELSPREQQVLDCLLENLANKEIANRLNISERTAKFHVSNILQKFGVQRRADLIMLLYQKRHSG